ncbi:TPA: 2Fe-2S iron-sulfur cluster-binding protein [Enterobacter chengduensis]|uniref:2Fe-2S ferredoxin-type domain-containing protein n=3 Tax=Enterobacter chengduensis TaxID=2494701 RepID=A0AAW3HI17_9ENTR|nr:iron-sulfur cluster-binding domain-containing protein [Enterobacter chengduensis]KDF49482.1 hypothetical protein AE07_00865 [Enterobacter cloacae BWH 43]OTW33070.1 hypothetical protein CAP57_20955 [Enterobacter kobei]GJL39006.1 hypothetical protein TUM17577_02150 [Enterobacter asburiae]KJX36674.1 hypothetical protein SG71_10175 [Enterobacter chengduensis]MBN9876477.1 iron-sulfur cluster-binding domain-containing protein [Enterobacter chengduensis]
MKLICAESTFLTQRIRMFRLIPVDKDVSREKDIYPGQYLNFLFRDTSGASFHRCYTVVNSEKGEYYDVIIEDKGEGHASATLSRLLLNKKEVEVTEHGGEITFNTLRDKTNVLLMANGIGITLPLALLRESFRHYGYTVAQKNVVLQLSCTDLKSMPCLNELLDLHLRSNWFTLRINVTRASPIRHSEFINSGRIEVGRDVKGVIPDIAIICGSVGFAQTMMTALQQHFPKTTIAVEAFSSAPALKLSDSEPVISPARLTVQNMGREINVTAGATVLENLMQHGIPIRNMCRSGICGSCKFRLIGGEVQTVPDFCLSTKDHQENIHLACCSYSEKDIVIETL